MHFKDQLHRKIELTGTPNRIISLVPSQTELLFDLGLRDKIVGITKFCVHPKELRKNKSIVGGTKQVDFKKISALAPDIIICNKEENTKEMVARLETIAPVWVSDIYTIEDTLEMICQFGTLFSVEEKAGEIAEAIITELQAFKNFMGSKPTQKVAYVIWKNPYMVAGQNTFINHLLHLNKFENIFNHKDSRYPQIRMEELDTADTVLLSTEPFPFKNDDVDQLKNALSKKVHLVDGEYFSWYGSRLLEAFSYFKTLH
ncbi:MAG: cobalamin-binding protein [Flavobacteriaceae bacterium]|nr:cobalamin-binding protein [Flavobacteriaceae bacterium]